jgi:mannose-1-phosphate guanylyltransferase
VLFEVSRLTSMLGWDDVGDFSSLTDILPAESNQPRILGDSQLGESSSRLENEPYTYSFVVLTEQVAGGIVVPGSGRLVACLGVDDLVIVDMPDTLMITTRARSQEVKRLVKRAKDAGWKTLL